MLWSLPDTELTVLLGDLQVLIAQAEAASLAAVREADRRDLGRTAGATSTGSWLSGRLRIRPENAARTVKLARDLDTSLPLTAMALRAGEISVDHASVIARSINDLPDEAGTDVRHQAEQVLVADARVFHPKDLAGLGRSILNAVDPDLADRILAKKLAADEARANRQRELTLTDDPHGLGTWIRGRLDPVTADMFRTALEPLSKPMPTTADGPDPRTASQRLGDGFAELLRRYLASGESPSQGGEKPHLIITIDWDEPRQRHRRRLAAAHRRSPLGSDSAGVRLRRHHHLAHDPRRLRHRQRQRDTARAGRRWSTGRGCLRARLAASSNSETAAAPSPAAIVHPPGVTDITSPPGSTAGLRPSRTVCCSVATTIALSTKDPGPYA